jgi:hypothetical protein
MTSAKLIRLPTSRAAPAQLILAVEFVSADGRTWTAIGGGETVAAAIAGAEESCPADTSWDPLDWNDLYGD